MIKTFKNKKILITGHTGFKGSWLTHWLLIMGANVTGFSKDIPTKPSLFDSLKNSKRIDHIKGDITNPKLIKKIISKVKPDYIFHLAGQSIVANSFTDTVETWQTNTLGTVNVLNSLKYLNKKCSVVMVTSDKCYENVEWLWGYKETDKLGGHDPYSASKASAELAINSFYKSFFKSNSKIRIASARAGNVIGGGDWSNYRIIPDCIKSWSKKRVAMIRNPNSYRPWQHVLEPIVGYLYLATRLNQENDLNGESFNFGPKSSEKIEVKHLVKLMSKKWLKSKWKIQKSSINIKESVALKLNCEKANMMLEWEPALNINHTIDMTIDWYKKFYYKKSDINSFTTNQINDYISIAKERKIKWAIDY